MPALARFIALFTVCGALEFGQLRAGDAPASQPATRPATTRPACPKVVPQTRGKIAKWVAELGSGRYAARRQARENLNKIVSRPGVDEVLAEHFRAAEDPEVKAALEELLVGFGRPVAMVWRRGWARSTANGFRQRAQVAGAPCLLVSGDGGFVYDAASPYFTGKMEDAPRVEFRQGRLNPAQVWKLKEMIARSGVVRRPSAGSFGLPTRRRSAIHVSFYARSGNSMRTSLCSWSLEGLRRGKRASGDAELSLAVAVRDFIASCAAKPYKGPVAVHAERDITRNRSDIAKLPDWPIPGIDLRTAGTGAGIELGKKELKMVRGALAKTNMYKYGRYYAYRVFLVPALKDARDLLHGTSSGKEQLRLQFKR